MSDEQADLVRRLRYLLPDYVREVSMFGGLVLMLGDKMVVSTRKDGSLLVRIDPARYD